METIIGGAVGLVVGAVVTAVTPSLVSGAGTALRGVAREVIKGGLVVQEAASGMFSGGGGYFSDLVAEARAELAATSAAATQAAGAKAAQ